MSFAIYQTVQGHADRWVADADSAEEAEWMVKGHVAIFWQHRMPDGMRYEIRPVESDHPPAITKETR